MRPAFNPNPNNPMQVATTAQQMAKNAGEERMAVAFQVVALCSMAIMGAAAATQILRDLRREDRHHGR